MYDSNEACYLNEPDDNREETVTWFSIPASEPLVSIFMFRAGRLPATLTVRLHSISFRVWQTPTFIKRPIISLMYAESSVITADREQ